MRQVCHRLLGAREKTSEIQLERFRGCVRVRGVSTEDGKRSALYLLTCRIVFERNWKEYALCDIGYVWVIILVSIPI